MAIGSCGGSEDAPLVRKARGCHPPVERLAVGHLSSQGSLICPCSWFQYSVNQMLMVCVQEWPDEDRAWLVTMTMLVSAAML